MLSVLIPAYNAASYIEAALLSVLNQQLDCPIEVLVCDDGSLDATPDVVRTTCARAEHIKLFCHDKNQGVSAARNTLLSKISTRSQFVAFLDADDMFVDGVLSRNITRLRSNPNARFTIGKLQIVPTKILDTGSSISDHWPKFAGVSLTSCLFRTEFVQQIGNFNTTLIQGEDVDFLLRAGELTREIVAHADVNFYYRRHTMNTTNNLSEMRSGMMKALLLHAQRRRLNPELFDAKGILPEIDAKEVARSFEYYEH